MPTYTKPLVSLDEASSCGLWLHDNLGSHASDTQGLTSDTSTNSDGLPKPEQGVFEVLQCTRRARRARPARPARSARRDQHRTALTILTDHTRPPLSCRCCTQRTTTSTARYTQCSRASTSRACSASSSAATCRGRASCKPSCGERVRARFVLDRSYILRTIETFIRGQLRADRRS